MPADPPIPTAAPVPQKRWRWVRRAAGTGLLGVLGLSLFYRPIGHWSIGHFGKGALTKAGITGSWRTSGNLWSGLTVDELNLTGHDTAALQSATLRHASLEYDLWALRGGGPGTVLKRLVVQDLELTLDLSKPPVPRPPDGSAKPKSKPQLPQVELPEIRIEHVSLRLRLPHDVLVVRDFSLVLDPAGPGLVEAALLELPGTPRLVNVRGVTHLKPSGFTLEDLVLAPDLMIESLALDLSRLAADEAGVVLKAHQGPTRLELTAQSGAWFTSTTADLQLGVSGISQETLAFWGVPSGGVAWWAGRVDLTTKGPVLRPDQLETTLAVRDGGFSVKGTEITPVSLDAGMSRGTFSLTNLSATLGKAGLEAEGQSFLPESWATIAKVPGQLDYTLKAPQLNEALPSGVEVSGKVEARGRIGFADLKLTEASAGLVGEAVNVQGIPMEKLTANARLVDGVAILDPSTVTLNARNSLTASGKLALEGARPFDLSWQADAEDLATVPAEVRAGLLWPSAGKVKSTGTASGLLTGCQAGQWDSLHGKARVEVAALRLNAAPLNKLTLDVEATRGAVAVQDLTVELDPENHLHAQGNLDLGDASRPLSGSSTFRIPDISKISAWSTSFGGPALLKGKAELDWQGHGSLHPLNMESAGSLTVQGLRLEGVPETLGLSLNLNQNGGEVRMPRMLATAGSWRAEAKANFDGWHLTIPTLTAFAQDQKLVDLSARIPLHGGGVPADSPVSLDLKVEALDAARLATALGRPFPVQGLLKADGHFDGTLGHLTGNLTAEASGVRPVQPPSGQKLDPATIRLVMRLQPDRVTVEGTATQPPLKPLTLTASAPMDPAALMADPKRAASLPLSAQVRLPASSLSFLPAWVPALRSVAGTAAADFTVSGTVSHPVWQGGATLQATEALFTSASLPTVKDLKVKIRADERRMTLEDVSVMLAGGRLHLTGGAGLENPADPVLDLKLNADEVLVVRDENLSLRANAAITCRGPVSLADVRGQVDLVRGRVFKEIEFFPLSLPNDLPPPPPSTTLGKQAAPSLPKPFDQWNFDIAIRTRDPVRLMGNVARGNAVADLKLAGRGGSPELTGKIRLEEMWLKLPFSRLNITEGAVTFTREQPFDPRIDITGESITGGRIVQVFVQGRALDPKVRLTSSPPLPEGEIATLLATGVTTTDLTSSGDEAAGRAAYVLLKQTYRKLFPNAATSSDDDEPPRLSFDFSVFGSDPARRGVSAIYELNPRWRVIGRVGETGTFRGLLHYLIRFR